MCLEFLVGYYMLRKECFLTHLGNFQGSPLCGRSIKTSNTLGFQVNAVAGSTPKGTSSPFLIAPQRFCGCGRSNITLKQLLQGIIGRFSAVNATQFRSRYEASIAYLNLWVVFMNSRMHFITPRYSKKKIQEDNGYSRQYYCWIRIWKRLH